MMEEGTQTYLKQLMHDCLADVWDRLEARIAFSRLPGGQIQCEPVGLDGQSILSAKLLEFLVNEADLKWCTAYKPRSKEDMCGRWFLAPAASEQEFCSVACQMLMRNRAHREKRAGTSRQSSRSTA